jgi:hypothetical protein
MRVKARGPWAALGWALLGSWLAAAPADAQGYFARRRAYRPAYQPTAAVVPSRAQAGLAPSPMLGSFDPNPFMTVGGNGVSGGDGYTPMQQYGGGAMAMYGPFASLRAIAAPVTTYSRGYDGIVREGRGTTTSYPFLPPAGAVVYPTRAIQRGGFGYQRTPPWWDAGYNWVDYN